MSKARVLIAESQSIAAMDLKSSLQDHDYKVTAVVSSGEEAVTHAREYRPDLVLLDISLSGAIDGIEACRQLQNELNIPVIFLMPQSDPLSFERARETTPYGYLTPSGIHELNSCIEMAMHRRRLECRLSESEEKYRALAENLNGVIVTTDTVGCFTESAERTRHEIESRLRHVLDVTNDGIYDVNLLTGEIYCNDCYYSMLGYGAYEIPASIQNWIAAVHGEDRERVSGMLSDHLEGKTPVFEYTYRMNTKSGDWKWILDRGKVVERDSHGTPLRMIGTHVDVTQVREASEELQKSTELLSLVLDNVRDSVRMFDLRTMRYTFANLHAREMFGLSPDEYANTPMGTNLNDGNAAVIRDSIRDELEHDAERNPRRSVRLELEEYIKPLNRTIWTESNATFVRDLSGKPVSILSITRDITDRKLAEERLRKSLAEKEVLLKEIHHRVKNNFQIINSLLNLQANHITEPEFLEIFRDSQNRIRAMSLIHEKIYHSSDLAQIDFKAYATLLAHELQTMFSVSSRRIGLKIDADELFLGADQALPCGLIINELVTNAFKHAFPPRCPQDCSISITLRRREDGFAEITVSDNGIGIPGSIDLQKPGTLGLSLVPLLISQIRGEMFQSPGSGTVITIRFKCRQDKSPD